TDFDIYAQHLLSDGSTAPGLWVPANGVAVAATGAVQTEPAIAPDGSSGVFIAWRDERDDLGNIYLQHVLSSGSPAIGWPVNGKAIRSAANVQHEPTVVYDNDGGCIVAWADGVDPATGSDIYAARVNGAGDVLWTVPVCVINGSQDIPEAIADGYGG